MRSLTNQIWGSGEEGEGGKGSSRATRKRKLWNEFLFYFFALFLKGRAYDSLDWRGGAAGDIYHTSTLLPLLPERKREKKRNEEKGLSK